MINREKLDAFNAWAQAISTIVIIAGIIVATITYVSEGNRERRVYTFEMSARYFSGEILSAREELQRVYLDAHQSLPTEYRSRENVGSLIRARYAAGDLQADRFESNIFIVLEFFNVAYSCVEQGLCRRQQLIELTQREADEINCAFRSAIREIEAKYSLPDLRRGLNALSAGATCI